MTSKYQIKNIDLSPQGDNAIYLAKSRMPTLLKIKRRFEKEKPLKGFTIGACLHVTKETAVLAQTSQRSHQAGRQPEEVARWQRASKPGEGCL